MKNLVMGAATGYDWYALEPFVTSCKKFCPDADLVLFVDDISDFTRNKLIREGVTLEPVPAEFADILIVNSRFKMYLDFLETHGEDYAQVLITDTRDVIFQSDLFAPFKNYSSWLGYSTEFLTIGEDADCNYIWLLGRFGKAEADKLSDKQAICAGTVIGSIDAMKIFCRKMWELILQALKKNYDQAAMNYLVWNNLLPIEKLIEFDVQSGAIFTNELVIDHKMFEDKILRGDGGIPAVVHRYVKYKEQVQLVDKVYRDKNFQVDERFTDFHSLIDQINYLFFVARAEEAVQFFTKIFSARDISGELAYKLLKFWHSLVLKAKFDSDTKKLELAIQSFIATIENPTDEFLGDMVNVFAVIIKNNRPIAPQFKKYFARHLLPIAKRNLDTGNFNACLNCIHFIEALNVPLDKNFYLFVAKANRILGRKEQALAAYKAALELN